MKVNKPGKYIKYAIGEIVLVVIGILIALSINNWNENRKEKIIGRIFLEEIKSDLEKDIEETEDIIEVYLDRLNILKLMNPRFQLDSFVVVPEVDTTGIKGTTLFNRGISFRSNNGTYNSMIADGKTYFIQNKNLFQRIQNVYDQHKRIYSLYESIKIREDKISWKYSKERLGWNLAHMIKDEQVLADLEYFWGTCQAYCRFLYRSNMEMKSLVEEIKIELNK